MRILSVQYVLYSALGLEIQHWKSGPDRLRSLPARSALFVSGFGPCISILRLPMVVGGNGDRGCRFAARRKKRFLAWELVQIGLSLHMNICCSVHNTKPLCGTLEKDAMM